MDEWKPIATVPDATEVELSIHDGGEYHALVFPCRREGPGWRDLRANRLLVHFQPTHWRPWQKKYP
jgi:hypothetical protein